MNILKLCTKKEINQLMMFIGRYWKKKHILSVNKKFFDWQFYNYDTKKYNFLISIKNGSIVGCLGFIPSSHYSQKLKKNDIIWLVNWLVLKNQTNPLSFLGKIFKKNKFIGTTGNTSTTETILKNLRFKTGNLNHWYFINTNKKKFNLIKFKQLSNLSNNLSKNSFIKKIVQPNELKKILLKNTNKNFLFFKNRYFNHPIYKYEFYGIYKNKIIKSFFVTRICKYKKSFAIRIIDFYGNINNFENLDNELIKLLELKKAEYIDLYEYGTSINKKKFPFKLNKYNKNTIIPNHYEPFVKKNIKIKFAITENIKKNPIFKGDCDQDRPS